MSTVPRRLEPARAKRRRQARNRRRLLIGVLTLALTTVLLDKTAGIWSSPASSQRTSKPSPVDARRTASPTPPAAPSATATLAPDPTTSPASADTLTPGRSLLLRVPVMSQLPALPNGCEATSLAMLLTAAGIPTDKLVLAREQKTNPAQPVFRAGYQGNLSRIQSWGDPNEAFVGNVYGRYGYGIYHAPLFQLLKAKAGQRAEDLTGSPFSTLLDRLDRGQAVFMWATTTLRPTTSWVTWQGPRGTVRATFKEHAVVLVGRSRDKLIINNPLTGRQETVPATSLIGAWKQLGRQALTVNPST